MRKLSGLQQDLLVTLMVLIAVTVYLNITNYQNHLQGTVPSAKQLTTTVLNDNAKHTEQIYLFASLESAVQVFPDFQASVDWSKQSVIAYVGLPQSGPNYRMVMESAKRSGNYLNITYRTVLAAGSESDTSISAISYPALFVEIDKSQVVAGSDLHIQFIEASTGHTQTLRLPPNEI
jgi:hypothetical protein